MQEAMKNPAVQQQMQEYQAAMQDKGLQEKLKGLQDDPEFKDMFEDIQKNGMGAMMKYMNDQTVLQKLGQRMGDVAPSASAAAAATPPAATEVNDLFDAARFAQAAATMPSAYGCTPTSITLPMAGCMTDVTQNLDCK